MKTLLLKDAIFEMITGDIFRPCAEHLNDITMNSARALVGWQGETLDFAVGLMNISGRIIPAKKEPVTEKQAWRDYWPSNQGSLERVNFTEIWKASAENTHLLYADLVDAAQKYMSENNLVCVDGKSETVMENRRAFCLALDRINNMINQTSTPE